MAKQSWKYLVTKKGEKIKVDFEDFDRLSKHSWRVIVSKSGNKQSVVTSLRTPKGVRSMSMGQFLLDPPKGKFAYPRRWQQGLDYRKENLIICSMSERQRLLPKRSSSSNTSSYKGVSYNKREGKWRARIEIDGTSKFIGDFDSEDAAARAYNKVAKEQLGDKVYFNAIKKRKNRRQ